LVGDCRCWSPVWIAFALWVRELVPLVGLPAPRVDELRGLRVGLGIPYSADASELVRRVLDLELAGFTLTKSSTRPRRDRPAAPTRAPDPRARSPA
jgi:hypothetical protein